MNALARPIIAWAQDAWRAWDRFWFTPAQPHTLAMIRILGGGMILYTHLVWSLNLQEFLGAQSWMTKDANALLNQLGPGEQVYAWSYLAWIDSPAALWAVHILGLVIVAMLVAGLWTRWTSILTFVITLSYCHRLTASLFGLDQVNALIATYLMFGRSGDAWSVDRWLAARRGQVAAPPPAIGTNVAIRLIQLHMCIVYLFGGIGKLRGELWMDGSALWYGFANLEYQSLDMTWTVYYPWIISLLTHVTVYWETFYCFLIWPKITRPICLAMAVGVHGGIALCLGMKTFGLAMIIGNLAFVPPEWMHATVALLTRPLTRIARSPALSTAPPPAHAIAARPPLRTIGS